MKLTLTEKLCLLIAVTAHVLVQALNITRWHVWHDESFSAMLIEYNWGEIIERAARDVHPPLYYLVLKVWAGIFGTSEVALRSLSVVLGVGVLIASYVLLRRLFTRSAAMWSLPILALAPFMVRYGHEMRMYTLAGLFIVLNVHLFLSIVRGKKAWWLWAGYILTLTAAIYSHYYAGLILAAEGVYLLYLELEGKKQWWKPVRLLNALQSIARKWLLAWVGIFLLFAPWVPTAIAQVTEIQGAFWIRPVSHESFYSTLTSLLFFRESYVLEAWHSVLSMMIVGAFFVLVGKLYVAETTYRKSITLLGLIVIVPAVLLFTSSLVLQPTYFDRYFTFFAFAFYGLLGVSMYFAVMRGYWNKFGTGLLIGIIALGVLLGNMQIIQYGDFDGDRSRFTMRDIMSYVEENSEQSDVYVTAGLWTYFDARFYATNKDDVQVYIPYELEGGMGNSTLIYQRDDLIVKDLTSEFTRGQNVWYFTESKMTFDEIPDNWVETGNSIELGYAKVAEYIVR